VSTVSATGKPADWRAVAVQSSRSGTTFTVEGPRGVKASCRVQLPGDFNVANALLAVAALGEAGLPVEQVCAGVSGVPHVPGRMERVETGQDFLVVVDYAHKPEALRAVLRQLRSVVEGRLSVVLGAGGDRDVGKRAVMGEVAARLADLVVVTDDNPRSEDPGVIRAALLGGARALPPSDRAELLEVPDRAEAIATALRAAGAGDGVLIAGKGHEQGQEAAGRSEPFDDKAVATAELTRLRGRDR
jgi:UDP-N-acetylmuramoyl-L-alanyl-D-glutamate--2,6-diaminopimelate ligase